jgi:putative spermidine/putrescine transport system permease protein
VKTSQFINKSFFYVCVCASCLPLVLLLLLALGASWPYPLLLPKVFSFEYFQYVFLNNTRTFKAVITSVLLAFIVTLLALAIAIPAARSLVLHGFKGKGFVKLLVLLPLVIPAVSVTSGIQVSMIKMGLSGSFAGVILIHCVFALPYAIRIMLNVFHITGDKYERQAAVLGANAVLTFFKVTLPVIMPGILSAAAICFSVSIGQYITTFLIGGGRVITVSILLIPYIQSGQVQIMSVYSMALLAGALLSLFFIERAVRRFYNLENVVFV